MSAKDTPSERSAVNRRPPGVKTNKGNSRRSATTCALDSKPREPASPVSSIAALKLRPAASSSARSRNACSDRFADTIATATAVTAAMAAKTIASHPRISSGYKVSVALPIGLVLVAAGATLVWGVDTSIAGIDVDTIGVIGLVVGALGIALALVLYGSARVDRTQR